MNWAPVCSASCSFQQKDLANYPDFFLLLTVVPTKLMEMLISCFSEPVNCRPKLAGARSSEASWLLVAAALEDTFGGVDHPELGATEGHWVHALLTELLCPRILWHCLRASQIFQMFLTPLCIHTRCMVAKTPLWVNQCFNQRLKLNWVNWLISVAVIQPTASNGHKNFLLSGLDGFHLPGSGIPGFLSPVYIFAL